MLYLFPGSFSEKTPKVDDCPFPIFPGNPISHVRDALRHHGQIFCGELSLRDHSLFHILPEVFASFSSWWVHKKSKMLGVLKWWVLHHFLWPTGELDFGPRVLVRNKII